ncbi:hypothetical protein JTE90_024643 [Oedothorax gibbosus]|uniref:TLC domain-containing protein n=1 Tax=Oedothorax gibbosus TaxID=931172 RepID=A0AAV6U3H7_9ARAC|nr:hypothetical protein JTE90_024643 [Oedothorax gibbosus]
MAANTDWEDFPTYSELVHGIRNFVLQLYQDSKAEKNASHSAEPTWQYYNYSTNDLLFVILLSIIWTVFRHFASEKIFKPLAVQYGLSPTNQAKMPESAWKFTYYLCAWSFSLYVVVLSGKYTFFQKPSSVWTGWSLGASPPVDIYLMYMGQCGFYLHSLYATMFLDQWRKDSLVMMIHHVLTLALISISYLLRYHNIGTLVLLTHDFCDILLEFTKLNVYFKIQNGKLIKAHELCANASFLGFSVAWFVSRLYCYPMRVLYAATYYVQKQQLELPCALLMNSLLWILQILNIYWFLFILKFLYCVATGQVSEVDDIREHDVEEKLIKLRTLSSSSTNGAAKTNDACDDGIVTNGNAKIRDKKAD